ncbi:MAG: exopolyphosphatase [Alphaproteobacteria bacterium]|nr:MAG: exopolyphosphatase [Alphaproteobacteria bacterium]
MNTETNNQTDNNRRNKRPRWQKSKKKPDSSGRKNNNQKPAAKQIYSAIDLGTNNCRLLVAQKTENGFKVIDSFSRIVRLGEGLSKNGTLSKEAIDRTIEALDICVAKIKRRGVTHIRNVATQACREATNCDEFIERVEKEVRIKLHIIDPAEEARLAVMGCKALLDRKFSNAIVFDIGGGSTELIWVKIRGNGMPEIIDWTSVPFGVVNLSEKYGTKETVSKSRYAEMRQDILSAIKSFEQKNDMEDLVAQGQVQLMGTSGTITTLTAMHLELDYYDRNRVDGTSVKSARIRELCQQLSLLNYEERVALKSIGSDRADLVVAGCAILESIMDLWPIEEIRVADRGIREGMLLDMMNSPKPGKKNNRRRNNKRRRNRPRRTNTGSQSMKPKVGEPAE